MQQLETLFMAIGLLILTFEFFVVFRPSLTQLASMMTSLRQKGEELADANIKLPVMGGDELARQASADPELARIPVIAVTASAMPAEIEAMRTLFRCILLKPVRKGELLSEMATMLPCDIIAAGESADVQTPVRDSGDFRCRDRAGLLKALALLDSDYQVVRKTLQVNRIRLFSEAVTALAAHHEATALRVGGDARCHTRLVQHSPDQGGDEPVCRGGGGLWDER